MSQSFFGGPLRSFRKSYRDFAETKWAKEGHLLRRVLHRLSDCGAGVERARVCPNKMHAISTGSCSGSPVRADVVAESEKICQIAGTYRRTGNPEVISSPVGFSTDKRACDRKRIPSCEFVGNPEVTV